MGQTLSEPIVEKHSASGGDERCLYGASCMQGWRITMEDAHTTILKLDDQGKTAFFGVFDGHGGANVAQYCGEHLHNLIKDNELFGKEDYQGAIKEGYLKIDDIIRGLPEFQEDPSGCTCIVSMVAPGDVLYVGNVGDSRAVLSSKGEAIPLSIDHKPSNQAESMRIRAAGGFVESGRVNGALALSRAIGDFEYKKNETLPPDAQLISACPDIVKRQLTKDDEFMVMACDGIWDCYTNQQVINFIRERLGKGMELQKAAEELMDHCVATQPVMSGIGCDNMTVLVVGFLLAEKREDWVLRCARPSPLNTPENTIPPRQALSPSPEIAKTDEFLSGVKLPQL